MAKKQTRRSISVSRTTYEKLKSFCEVNNISMSQFVETRVGDFLGEAPAATPAVTPPAAERPRPAPIPMTSAAARYAIEPPPPIIKPKQQETAAPKPAEKKAEQIFTF